MESGRWRCWRRATGSRAAYLSVAPSGQKWFWWWWKRLKWWLWDGAGRDVVVGFTLVRRSLSSILVPGSIPEYLSSSKKPAFSLLTDDDVASRISSLLRQPDSGAGDNHLCRWLYDTFQSSDPNLQLIILRFLPIIAGVYMSRVPQRKPLAGFEAILLALYSHKIVVRNGASVMVLLPDLSHSSIYHEKKSNVKSNTTELNLAVVSPSLEPHGTVRSTRRARIMGVTLELFFSKISSMPKSSKMDFCEFCTIWAGQDGEMYRDSTETAVLQAEAENKAKEGRIPLQWELLVPVLRIIGHCLGKVDEGLQEAAFVACRSLYARAMHDVDARAILATGSLLRVAKMAVDSKNQTDFTELPTPEDGVLRY